MVFNEMIVDPSDPLDDRDTRNVLGLIPLVRITSLNEGGRAALSGMREGDVIVEFGSHRYPTQKQITETIRNAKAEPDSQTAISWRNTVRLVMAMVSSTVHRTLT